jgi:prepilin-type N-terminal cleavage/methylation domain-containing protein
MTLLEIMVVLAIMGILIAIGLPTLQSMLGVQERGAAKELALTYKFLLNEAALRNVTFRIAYNLDAGSYKIEVGDPDTLIFGDPQSRQDAEDERMKALKKYSKKDIEEGKADELDAKTGRFAKLDLPGFQTDVSLPDTCQFAWVYTPQYSEAQTPSDSAPTENAKDTDEGPKIVYSYVFANGVAEHTVVRIVSMDDPEDGYTVEVEPLSGKVSVESEERDIGASMAWLPSEAPNYR